MKQCHISHIAPLHHEWTRGLEFYQMELDILQERLEEIAGGNTGHEVAEGVEHYQNQLLIHRDAIASLKQRIHRNILRMEEELQKQKGFLKENTVTDFEALESAYHTEESLVKELRTGFNHFAAKWL